MAKARLDPAISYLRYVLADYGPRDRTDGELLREFLSSNNQHAFAQLMKRHGPMVLGICRRVLRQEQDAEDALQATFLALACKASAIRKHESLASWLHGVAFHMANDARKAAIRRRKHLNEAHEAPPAPSPGAELAWREVRAILDGEIERLPAIYREPFILCCLENRSSEEVARTLRLKPGTVWSRVARAKHRLQTRLKKRGVELAVLLTAAAVSSNAASSAIPAGLIGSTAQTALEMTGGSGLTVSTISPNVAALLKGMMKAFVVAQLKAGALAVVAFALLTAGLGVAAVRWLPNPGTLESKNPQEKSRIQSDSSVPKVTAPGLDRFGDDLPAGVVARVGTVRLRHGNTVDKLVFAPDGKSLITAASDGFVHRWETSTGKVLFRIDLNELQRGNRFQPVPYFLGSDDADSLVVSPNGQTIAAACMNSQPRIWELASGRVLCLLGHDQIRADQIVFSPDSSSVAYGSGRLIGGEDDLAITMADATTGNEICHFVGHSGKIERFLFSPNDPLLISSSQDGTVRSWNVKTGAEVRRFQATSFALSAVGNTVALCSKDGSIEICNLNNGESIRKLEGKFSKQPNLIFSPDGKTLVGDNLSNHEFRVWDVATGQSRVVRDQGRVNQATSLFTPDSKLLIRGYSDGYIRFWNVATGECTRQIKGYRYSVLRLAVSSDGKVLASTDQSGTLGKTLVKLWDLSTGKLLLQPEAAEASVNMLAFSPDGDRVAASSFDGKIRIAEAATGKLIGSLPTFGPAAFLPDGQTLMTGGWDRGDLRLWNLKTFVEERFGSHPGTIRFLALSKDGKLLLVQDRNLMSLWDVASRRVLHEFGGKQADNLISSSLSSDGKVLAATCQNGEVRVWESGSGKLLWKHQEEDLTHAIAVSPDGMLLTWGAMTGNGRAYPIRVADVKTGKVLRTLSGDRAPGIGALMFSADGRSIFGGGNNNNRVQIWETATGNQRTFLVGHTGSIQSLATSADGALLASGSSDTSVLVWDLTGGHDLKHADNLPLPLKRLDELWNDLKDPKAAVAYESMRLLRLHSKEAIEMFRNEVKPVANVDGNNVARSNAREPLDELPDSERLRQGRVLEVVEWIGDDQAKSLLKHFAEGAPNAWLTKEAKTSLERLAMRSRRKR